ncbi:MAG: hypothetical protein RMK29_00295 [Myxococcales bacterium]|nr:hypothetical protein [Myxococcota bacterium]MDW8280115.1 hypothetical protein [Myxococcales bacterium]
MRTIPSFSLLSTTLVLCWSACGPDAWLEPLVSDDTLATASSSTEPDFIYGIHDPGGEHLMGSHRGWILFTVQCSDAPRDYRPWSSAGYGVVVRLNHGYGSAGTLPRQAEYQQFADRCASYARLSPGVHYWIVGNETNLPREWPGNIDGRPETGEPITVARYVDAYLRTYAAIKAVRPEARIIPAPAGTWAPPWPAQGLPEGFLDYWVRILRAIGPHRLEGLALHAYTHGCDPALITSEQRMNPPYERIHYHFRVYRDYMAAIPAEMRTKPVLITEANQNVECAAAGHPPRPTWPDVDSGWVRAAYREIDDWNRTAAQKIRALILFRWEMASEGEWTYGISERPGVLRDFQQAVAAGYRWRTGGGGGGGGNHAEVLASESQVPPSLAPGERREVVVRVRNRGGTTWRAGSAHRLGASPSNTVPWSGFACGGYTNGLTDARVFLCHDVPPGATHDFRFSLTGSGVLGVRMVQDGVEWFGPEATFRINDGGAACPCRSGIDNFCHHGPRTAGCPMTFPGGYCDPNGDGSYADADWVRGYTEYHQRCR